MGAIEPEDIFVMQRVENLPRNPEGFLQTRRKEYLASSRAGQLEELISIFSASRFAGSDVAITDISDDVNLIAVKPGSVEELIKGVSAIMVGAVGQDDQRFPFVTDQRQHIEPIEHGVIKTCAGSGLGFADCLRDLPTIACRPDD